VLLVDDNAMVLRCLKRYLDNAERPVIACTSAQEALRHVAQGNIQVVVSDISMPELSGLDLLRRVRELDMDLPVVLLTGVPSIDSAASAVEYGAFMYLRKPVTPEVLAITIERAIQAFKSAKLRRENLAWLGIVDEEDQLSRLEFAFENSLSSLWLAYQPIVGFSEQRIFAYEALLRSDHDALKSPEAILHAAERLGALNKLGRTVRGRAADSLGSIPEDVALFVNLHPQDLLDIQLLDKHEGLSQFAARIVLEITEHCGLASFDGLSEKVHELRKMGFRIAVDDLGAGYSGLANIAMLEPEFIKLDMALVRNIEQSAVKQKLVSSLISLSQSMGHSIIAEGVETPTECETLLGLGCDLFQGYLFARPARELPDIRWQRERPTVASCGGDANVAPAPQSQSRVIAAKQAS